MQAGPTEALTGNWHFHNFSIAYFDTGKPVTPFEVIPRVSFVAELCIVVGASVAFVPISMYSPSGLHCCL